MRLADFGLEPVLRQRRFDSRDQEGAIGGVVGVLELAAAALGEMAARRLLVMRAEGERAIVDHGVAGNPERHVATACRHPVPARGYADDELVHRRSRAAGIAAARSSAIICGPASSAARP